jgi:hypothetical protein
MDVPSLYAEATSVLRRWQGKKLPNYDALSKAKADVDQIGLANLVAGSPEANALLKEIESAWLCEHSVSRVSKRMTYACVGLALFVMYIVGSLYVFYNNGVSLLAEMETLAAKQPDRRFGQLERQLLIAQAELFSSEEAKASAPCIEGDDTCEQPGRTEPKIDELAQEATYVLLHELRDLSESLTSLQGRLNEYHRKAESPIPGIGWLANIWGTISRGSEPNKASAAGEPGEDAQQAPPPSFDPNMPPLSTVLCGSPVPTDGGVKSPATKKQVLGMDMNAVANQACDYSVAFTSMSVPSVNLWALQVKAIIAPYAAWALPALFAWLGVMVYFLRQMVDPAEPNPTPDRVVLRMALAALAGVIAGWFWEPAFGSNTEFKAAGLGLFTFAFVIGFSIEIFFSLLDRIVQISSTAITKLGS